MHNGFIGCRPFSFGCGRAWFVTTILNLAMSLAQADLVVSDAYVRGLPPTQKNTAAFFELHNTGEAAVTITPGVSDAAEVLEIHAHEHRDGMMAMRKKTALTLEAGARVSFVPGGLHLMLLNLQQTLNDGDMVTFSLRVDGAPLEISAPVVSVLKGPPSSGHH